MSYRFLMTWSFTDGSSTHRCNLLRTRTQQRWRYEHQWRAILIFDKHDFPERICSYSRKYIFKLLLYVSLEFENGVLNNRIL